MILSQSTIERSSRVAVHNAYNHCEESGTAQDLAFTLLGKVHQPLSLLVTKIITSCCRSEVALFSEEILPDRVDCELQERFQGQLHTPQLYQCS